MPPALYTRDMLYHVLVATADDPAGNSGDLTAMDALEAIETGLFGKDIAGVGQAQMVPWADFGGLPEALLGVHEGKYLYGQSWAVEGVETHSA